MKLFCAFLLLLLVNTSHSTAYEYNGFAKLNPDECTPLGKDVIVSRLPVEFIKYTGFVKMCKLVNKKGKGSQISIVSIWAHDYLDAQSSKSPWENFPLPIIVDTDFKPLGHLYELYPSGWVTDLNIFYGRWQSDIPTEIRVDVENPAVSGDYHYAPLIWSQKSRLYEIKSRKTVNGRRPQ